MLSSRRATIDGMDDQQLAAASSARDLIARGSAAGGRARVRAEQKCGFRPHRAGVGHRRRGYRQDLVSRRTRAGRPRRLAQTAGKAALAGTEEALQEVGEGVATQKGINAGASMDLDPLAGSFGNAALGFVAGMGPGAVHGAAEGVRHRMATAPTMEAGDVVHASGKPFITASAAPARRLGGDAQVLRFENGFIVRPGAGAPAQGAGAAPAEAGDAAKAAGTPAQEPGPGGASESAGFQPDQQVYVRQGGREIAVEFVGLERNAATARAGGEPLARIRTPDGRGHFVRLSELTPTRSPATPCARRPTCRRRSKPAGVPGTGSPR